MAWHQVWRSRSSSSSRKSTENCCFWADQMAHLALSMFRLSISINDWNFVSYTPEGLAMSYSEESKMVVMEVLSSTIKVVWALKVAKSRSCFSMVVYGSWQSWSLLRVWLLNSRLFSWMGSRIWPVVGEESSNSAFI